MKIQSITHDTETDTVLIRTLYVETLYAILRDYGIDCLGLPSNGIVLVY